jgi:hypothetical protein
MQNTIEQEQDEIRQVRSREIQELQTKQLRQRKLRQLHFPRRLNRKPRNHDNLARQALFKHLPDCKTLDARNASPRSLRILPSQTRPQMSPSKETEDINESVKKQENEEELPGEDAHKEIQGGPTLYKSAATIGRLPIQISGYDVRQPFFNRFNSLLHYGHYDKSQTFQKNDHTQK